MGDTSVNRIYIRRSDFNSLQDYKDYIAKILQMFTSVLSNIVVSYQSYDPNVYIIEVNSSDATINGVFPFWLTPEELLQIKKQRGDNSQDDWLGGQS